MIVVFYAVACGLSFLGTGYYLGAIAQILRKM